MADYRDITIRCRFSTNNDPEREAREERLWNQIHMEIGALVGDSWWDDIDPKVNS